MVNTKALYLLDMAKQANSSDLLQFPLLQAFIEKRAFSVVPPIITPDTLKSGDDNYDPNDTSRLTANPYNTFENKQTSREAFKAAKPSVSYMVTGVDASGNKYIDGAQTQKNIYGGDADFQRRAEEQMARARWEQARAGGLTNAENGPSLNHPVVLNPGGKGRSLWNRFNYRHPGYQTPPDASGNPNKQIPIKDENLDGRGFYSPSKDYIGLADPSRAPMPGVKFPQPIGSLPRPTLRYFDPNRRSPAYNIYQGVANNRTDPSANYTEQNTLQEEGTHAQSPTSFIPGMDKNNDPNVFAPKDKLPGEYPDKVTEPRRPWTPIVPGMQGSYDQWPGEFVKSRKLDQNDAQATYGHRIQNGKELLDYHNMLKVYGTDDEWEESQKNLSLQHAQALGRLRAMAIEQRKQEMEEARKSGVQPWISEDFIPLRPVQATYDFIDQTDLMKQVRNNQQPGRMDKIASTLNSSYNRLMNEARMMKIAATLRK
ncbi:hypothetical protein [Akkermansia muciniphila]|uniref:Uncharacterized protein n=1 Tax=Akkermansia muciniphila TaxID=239935 RepID=A0AAP8T8S4_9BACT|nr:hypothetical protein [Akkermansia muciniphila]PNC54622.1 hypothetical protein CXU09_08720 [Akkermansia muciniphila]